MDPIELLENLVNRKDLASSQAQSIMEHLLSGEATEAWIGGVLAAMRTKGVSSEELTGLVLSVRNHAVPIPDPPENLVDTCGTGGGLNTFNISTGAAVVAAACGAAVAKHGNRAVTSKCGSADVLEHLGIHLTADPHQASRMLHTVGISFLFAPAFHPAMKAVGPARKALGVRTVFNMIGPLSNPAGAKSQVVGVFDSAYVETVAHALVALGCDRGWVVHAECGMDEIDSNGATIAAKIEDSAVEPLTLHPSDFGLNDNEVDRNAGQSIVQNSLFLLTALSGENQKRSRAIVPNAAAALWAAGLAPTLKEGADMAWQAMLDGRAISKLEEWKEASRE
ncbi:MAG: anthranilate phosphoribosyltransferase [Armatimonadetes bacterium]|nr:anthranilate phosphoribosyltransferase [Armatimonadota bacterium]